MRFLLTIILLVLLPLQSIPAAAAAYDEQESHAQQQQFGHDNGCHHDDVATAVADGETPAISDADAGHCHGHFTAALVTTALTVPVPPASRRSACRTQVDWNAPSLSPPERPQWARHA